MRTVNPGEIVTLPAEGAVLGLPFDLWCAPFGVEPIGARVDIEASGVRASLVQHATGQRVTFVRVEGGRPGPVYYVHVSFTPRKGQATRQTFPVRVEGSHENTPADTSVAGWRKRFDEQREQRG
jgi:hypothetical protein